MADSFSPFGKVAKVLQVLSEAGLPFVSVAVVDRIREGRFEQSASGQLEDGGPSQLRPLTYDEQRKVLLDEIELLLIAPVRYYQDASAICSKLDGSDSRVDAAKVPRSVSIQVQTRERSDPEPFFSDDYQKNVERLSSFMGQLYQWLREP